LHTSTIHCTVIRRPTIPPRVPRHHVQTPMNDLPHVDGVQHRFIQARGLRFHVATAGSGPPLLLVHGWPQHWYMWRHQLPALARHFAVYCVDLRGLGWSDAPPSGYEKENMADDLLAVLDALELPRVAMAGHDWGGWIGFLACIKAPHRFSRYVALNIPHPFIRFSPDPSTIFSLWYQALIASPFAGPMALRRKPGFTELSFRTSMHHQPLSDADVEIYASRLRQPARARASQQIYRTFITGELWSVLNGRYRTQRLTVPTLVLFGKDDVAISTRLLDGLDEFADDARIEFVDHAGHFIAEEQPELVAQRLMEFLGDVNSH